MKLKKVDAVHVFGFLNIILKSYDVSQAVITLVTILLYVHVFVLVWYAVLILGKYWIFSLEYLPTAGIGIWRTAYRSKWQDSNQANNYRIAWSVNFSFLYFIHWFQFLSGDRSPFRNDELSSVDLPE